MADNIINAKIQEAYDSEAEWAQKNPVLLAGQLAFSSDRYGWYKIGDGTSNWSQLEYHLDTEMQRIRTAGVFYNPTNVVSAETIDLNSNMDTVVQLVLNALPDADVARY